MRVRLGFVLGGLAGVLAGAAVGQPMVAAIAAGVLGGVVLTRLADATHGGIGDRLWLVCLIGAYLAYSSRRPAWLAAWCSALIVSRVHLRFRLMRDGEGMSRVRLRFEPRALIAVGVGVVLVLVGVGGSGFDAVRSNVMVGGAVGVLAGLTVALSVIRPGWLWEPVAGRRRRGLSMAMLGVLGAVAVLTLDAAASELAEPAVLARFGSFVTGVGLALVVRPVTADRGI